MSDDRPAAADAAPETTQDIPPALRLTRGVRVMWALIAGAVCAAVVLRYDVTPAAAVFAVLALLLVCAAAGDAATWRIPNALVLTVVLLWVVSAAVSVVAGWRSLAEMALQCALGALAAVGPALLVTAVAAAFGKEGFGGGDLKLLAAVGLFFTWRENLVALVIACVVGAVLGLVLKLRRGVEKLPFGVGIAVGWIALILL